MGLFRRKFRRGTRRVRGGTQIRMADKRRIVELVNLTVKSQHIREFEWFRTVRELCHNTL